MSTLTFAFNLFGSVAGALNLRRKPARDTHA